MKRILSVIILLIIAGSLYAPFVAEAKPTDYKHLDASTGVATLSKWGGTSTLKVTPTNAVKSGGKLKLGQNIEVKVEEREGEVEYSWILAAKPTVNVFYLTLDFTGCTFIYQPPLTAAQVKAGDVRPENVVGSYAVYGSKTGGIYQTGKIAHIYRPLVTDAKGKTTWGILNIVGDTLSVTVDQAWLDKATYPVIVDPTFGYNVIGASNTFLTLNSIQGSSNTTAATTYPIYATSMSIYCSSGAGVNLKLGVWADGNGGAVVQMTNAKTMPGGAAAWHTLNFAAPTLLTASTTYQLGAIADNTILVYYDAGGTGHADGTNSYATPGPFTWDGTNTNKYSIYLTYEYGPQITSSVITDIDDTSNVYTMKKHYAFTTVITDGDGATDIASISVRGSQGGVTRWMVNATSLDGVPSYAIAVNASTIDLNVAGCSFTEAGTQGTLVLSIRFEWDAANEADCELDVWCEDVTGVSAGWTTVHADYFSVISRLVTHNYAGNLTSTTVNMPVEISGYVRYAMTPTGFNASTSYPPDAQFNSVKIYDGEGGYAGVDSSIVNGFFNLTITSAAVLKTTYYYAWLDLVADYTPGYAVDGDYVPVTTAASFSIIETVNEGFSFFGLAGNVTGVIIPTITNLAGWFTESATAVVDMTTGVLTLIFYISGTVTAWVARMANFFVNLLTNINRVFDGTIGGHNVWTEFNVSAWIDFIPVIAFVVWFGGLPQRSKRAGVSSLEVLIRDLQIASYIVGEVWNWSFTLFNFIVNSVMTFVSVVTG